nr:CRISPR-associated protein Cas14b.2 [uncultured archaeon]
MEESIITGVKFKLRIDKETTKKLNEYFDEYGKAINFAVKIIQKELADDRFAGKAKLDQNKNPILDENGKKIYEFPDEFCSCGKQVNKYVNNKPFCQECYKIRFTENGIRKRMYSAKGRKAEHKINILNSTNKISKTHFNYAIREAFILDKSIKKQRKKRNERLRESKKRLQQFIDMRDGKREICPTIKGQKVDRFIHPSWITKDKKLEDFRGYTLSIINSKIKILDRNIKREEKSLKEKGQIIFKAKRLMLDKSIRFVGDRKVLFTISKTLPKEYELDLPSKEKRLNWLKEKIEIIKNQKPKYAYLLRKNIESEKKPNYEYYLQYTLEIKPELKDFYDGAIGIDRGINHIAVCTFISNDGKVTPPKFFSSGEILRLKNLQKERDRFLLRKHNKNRKKGNMRVIENKINLILHRYSKQIVDMAKKLNASIVFEELGRIGKSRTKMKKSQRYKLSLFIFKKLSDLVDYKSRREGIRVTYVPPEYTSKECSHCGEKVNTQRPFNGNYSLFKCNKCGIQLNSDYNASINIAKKGLKIPNST